ncbi:MAG: phytanoyl-CoA dioxygenase family protein [Caulobacteraceae bacterium]
MLQSLSFSRDGAVLHPAALSPADLAALETALAAAPQDRAGVRLHGSDALRALLDPNGVIGGVIGGVARNALQADARPVRAVLFDKTAAANWSLAWHQDRTIVVRERHEVEGFGPWTTKQGLLHVAPPYAVLSGMATLRIHLDPTPAANAPLLIAPGSHRLGRIPESEVPATVARCGVVTCVAGRGDIWAYATPILHASEAAQAPARRRVLQVDYAAGELPGGLEWLGV